MKVKTNVKAGASVGEYVEQAKDTVASALQSIGQLPVAKQIQEGIGDLASSVWNWHPFGK